MTNFLNRLYGCVAGGIVKIVNPLDRYVLFLSVSLAAGTVQILRFFEQTANCPSLDADISANQFLNFYFLHDSFHLHVIFYYNYITCFFSHNFEIIFSRE